MLKASTTKLKDLFTENLIRIQGERNASEMASLLGFTDKYYYKVVGRKVNIGLDTIEEYADKLSVDPFEFFQTSTNRLRLSGEAIEAGSKSNHLSQKILRQPHLLFGRITARKAGKRQLLTQPSIINLI